MTRKRVWMAFGVALLLTAGCEKDKPKPEENKPAEATPVPSGLVFNDFLPTTGGAAGLGVRDAGLEGGLAGVTGAGDPGDPGAQQDPGAAKGGGAHLLEPGAEPRAVRKYTFTPNKVEKRLLTITQSVSQSAGGQTSPPQELTIKVAVDLTVKQVKPTGATLEVKVTKVDLPGAPPQAAQMLASMNGLAATFDVSPSGDVGELSFAGSPQMQNQLAESVLGGVSQVAQLLYAPLPTAPIGIGAKWELAQKSEAEQGAKRFTLREASNEGAVIDSEIEVKVPRRAQQDPRSGGTVFIEVDGKGKYTQSGRFNQPAAKADGEIAIAQKAEINDPKRGGKQSVTQMQKSHQTVETPGAK